MPIVGIQDKLGRWLHESCNIWDWKFDLENKKLMYLKGDRMDVYVPSNLPGTRSTANRWVRHRIDQEIQDLGSICTVRDS